MRSLTALVVVVVGAAACPEPPPPIEDNAAPVARLFLPQIAVTAVPVDVSAGLSTDEDGDALSFSFSFGDGTPEVDDDDGSFSHAWLAPGTFTVSVVVADERAFQADVEASIVVVDGVAEGCSCAQPCFDDGVCTDRGCLIFASSQPADLPAFNDELDCD